MGERMPPEGAPVSAPTEPTTEPENRKYNRPWSSSCPNGHPLASQGSTCFACGKGPVLATAEQRLGCSHCGRPVPSIICTTCTREVEKIAWIGEPVRPSSTSWTVIKGAAAACLVIWGASHFSTPPKPPTLESTFGGDTTITTDARGAVTIVKNAGEQLTWAWGVRGVVSDVRSAARYWNTIGTWPAAATLTLNWSGTDGYGNKVAFEAARLSIDVEALRRVNYDNSMSISFNPFLRVIQAHKAFREGLAEHCKGERPVGICR